MDIAKPKTPHKAKGSKKGRKIGRNYRWDGVAHSISKYRSRHGIGPGPRKDARK